MADQTTAEALADHQRWEWPLAVLIGGEGELAGWRVMHVDDCGIVFTRAGQSWAVSNGRLPSFSLAPDLADDATAGILLGMVREWGDERGFALDVLFGTQYSSVHVGPAGGYGPTLGEAAGGCLLSCWEYDAADGDAR